MFGSKLFTPATREFATETRENRFMKNFYRTLLRFFQSDRGSLLLMLSWLTDVTPVPHLHRDPLIHLFPVRKFGEINLDPKNNQVAFFTG